MASEVDICNLALAHLGDSATVASISPPEGSAQAEHCARFYPIARDSILEMHNWNFSTKRILLAQITNDWNMWLYAYALPNNCINPISVISSEAYDDYATRFVPTDTPQYSHNYSPVIAAGRYVPQPFTIETREDNTHVLYTNLENAVLRYQALVDNPTEFSSLFVMTLSWHLASMLAGPLIKGDVGAAEAKRCAQMMAGYLAEAKRSDGNQRSVKVEHIVPWTSGR
ncbi:hypothetical protein UFOVP824_10 [uncultured Caudovirales phage]|uniref:Uncharacterized protein n=1 Tax=uncultured Caudovirales phage TaxID=2100421 RepID=A0A6J5NZ61_9CAUD|nr:hypothetical protein UFOVP824_10 [uncultured Caudovirales phage]